MKYLFSFIILLLSVNLLFAQTNCKNDSLGLKHGLQFQVRTLSLSNFNGYAFAYRYLLDNNSGFRIGLFANISDEDLTETHFIDSLNFSSPNESIYYDLKFSVQYIKTILRRKEFSLIVGCGPFIAYQKRESNYNNHAQNYTRENHSESNSTYYGLDLLMGVEYHLSKNVVLSGEYGMSMSVGSVNSKRTENIYYTDVNEIDREYTKNSEGTNYLVKGIGASLGLSVFF